MEIKTEIGLRHSRYAILIQSFIEIGSVVFFVIFQKTDKQTDTNSFL